MRLINTKTWAMKEFFDSNIPKYAILSHRWEDDELTFQDFEAHRTDGQGFEKVKAFCEIAKLQYGCEWAWVDTCCIDKKSSAELSEAINSMYQWYVHAHVCVAYLSDVTTIDQLRESRWCTRGWTLQELLAPRSEFVFFNKTWTTIGTRKKLANILADVTNTPLWVLSSEPSTNLRAKWLRSVWSDISIYHKMSWASQRSTSRVEDVAYCLMGIFDVKMSLIYGEGTGAFLRLQKKIIKTSDDETIFVWYDEEPRTGMLATGPGNFRCDKNIRVLRRSDYGFNALSQRKPYQITNKGLQIHVHLLRLRDIEGISKQNGIPLNCCDFRNDKDRNYPIVIPVFRNGLHTYIRWGNPIQLTDDNWHMVLYAAGSGSFEHLLGITPMEEICLAVSYVRPVTPRERLFVT